MSRPTVLVTKTCVQCNKPFTDIRWKMKRRILCSRSCQVAWLWKNGKVRHPNKGKQLPEATKAKIKKTLLNKGDKHQNWKGDNVQYTALHQWLHSHYGKADHCANKQCGGASQRFEWAKKRECEYRRDVRCFVQLCKSCHTKYDRDISYNPQY